MCTSTQQTVCHRTRRILSLPRRFPRDVHLQAHHRGPRSVGDKARVHDVVIVKVAEEPGRELVEPPLKAERIPVGIGRAGAVELHRGAHVDRLIQEALERDRRIDPDYDANTDPEGDPVEVVQIEGLTLRVRPVAEASTSGG